MAHKKTAYLQARKTFEACLMWLSYWCEFWKEVNEKRWNTMVSFKQIVSIENHFRKVLKIVLIFDSYKLNTFRGQTLLKNLGILQRIVSYLPFLTYCGFGLKSLL